MISTETVLLSQPFAHDSKTPLTDNLIYRRKDLGDKVNETVTPDSQKSTLDKAQESATDAGDKVAGSVQPGRHATNSLTCCDVPLLTSCQGTPNPPLRSSVTLSPPQGRHKRSSVTPSLPQGRHRRSSTTPYHRQVKPRTQLRNTSRPLKNTLKLATIRLWRLLPVSEPNMDRYRCRR